MGVSITHPLSGTRLDLSYSGFARLRRAILDAAGPVACCVPESCDYHYRLVGEWEPRNLLGWWDSPPAEPLDVLFVHSDCEGWIFPEHALPLAARLESFIERIDPDEQGFVRRLVTILRATDDAWWPVRFS